MQDEDRLESSGVDRVDIVGLCGRREHHVQKVRSEAEAIVRIDNGLADGSFVSNGRYRRHLGDEADGRKATLSGVVDVDRVGIKRRESSHHAL
eukprot:scaffold38330_cov31-Tisochrysis_lutea.AAC.6